MICLPFLSQRAHDQVVHRRWNPLCLVTALLSTLNPPSGGYHPMCGCPPHIATLTYHSTSLPPRIFLSSRFSRTWLPSNAKQLNLAMLPHCATYAYMCSIHLWVHKVFPQPRSRCLAPMVSCFCNRAHCSRPLKKSSFHATWDMAANASHHSLHTSTHGFPPT